MLVFFMPATEPPDSANRFAPGESWLDDGGNVINAHGAGLLHHDGIYYWFGEHKIEGTAGNRAHVGVHVYSSRDLYHWHDEGIALAVSGDPMSPITRGCIIERPKVLHNARTGKFVMWFHLEPAGEHGYLNALRERKPAGVHPKPAGVPGHPYAQSGVAVADKPEGPYRFADSMRPNAGVWPLNVPQEQKQPLSAAEQAHVDSLELSGGPRPFHPKHLLFRRDFAGGQMARDMTLFADDDGTAYHFYSSEGNGTMHISQLSEDYLRPAGRYMRIFPGRFHEAPAVMKWKGRYFLITSDCTAWAPNAARVSAADSIWGPWEELGNPCLGPVEQMPNTYESQGTFILQVAGKPDAFIFVADRWRPQNAIDGRYVWLPMVFKHGVPMFGWRDRWDLSVFDNAV